MTTYTATITFKNISPEDIQHAQFVIDEETKYRDYKIEIKEKVNE